MKENFYPTIVYNNETIGIYLFKVYSEKAYLLFQKDVFSGDITKVSGFGEFGKIASALKKEILELENRFKQNFLDVYCMIEPKNFYTVQRQFNYKFNENYVIEEKDIVKMITKIKKSEERQEGFYLTTFVPQKLLVDGVTKKKLIGEKVQSLSMSGDLIFIDQSTFYAMEKLLDELNRNVLDYIVTNNSLKFTDDLNESEAIIEVESSGINFIYKDKDVHKNFRVNVGMGHIFEKIFLKLIETYSEKDAFRVTKYIQDHQIIEHQEVNFQIIPEVHINDVVDLYNGIFQKYMSSVVERLSSQNVILKEARLISYGYNVDFLVKQFNDLLKINTKKYRIPKIGDVQYPHSKLYIAVQKYNQLTLY